ATSKACRLAFSWIMAMAGLPVVPAEEVPPQGFSEANDAAAGSPAPAAGPPAAPPNSGPTWKGRPLREFPTDELTELRAWMVKRDPKKWAKQIEQVDEVLAARGGE